MSVNKGVLDISRCSPALCAGGYSGECLWPSGPQTAALCCELGGAQEGGECMQPSPQVQPLPPESPRGAQDVKNAGNRPPQLRCT